jgi:RND family efflux transporter MFP subunit
MLIIIGIYAAVVWLLFFRLKLLPWNTFSKVLVSTVGLGILFTFMGLLNTRTPSGRITVMAPTFEVAPMVSGIIAELPVKTHQRINKGDLLFSLDKRPFEYAVQQAQAQQKLAKITYQRLKTAVQRSPAAASAQTVDNARAQFEAASATLASAQYQLDRTDAFALDDGIIGAMRLQVGDKVAAYTPIMPVIRFNKARIWGVFKQNGLNAIKEGANVGISFRSQPGIIHWTQVIEIAPGIDDGDGHTKADMVGASDIGNNDELLVVLAWPEGMTEQSFKVGIIGNATVIGPEAGPIGSLAKILLIVKSYTQFL